MEEQHYEKFYRCVGTIVKAWRGKEGYEMDADRAMGIIEDLIVEGKFTWDEEKICNNYADFLPESGLPEGDAHEQNGPSHGRNALFPKTSNIFLMLFLMIAVFGTLFFFLERCGNKII